MNMQVSIEAILNKMQSELSRAKQQQDDVREHVAALRALCDLVLDTRKEPTLSKLPPTSIKETQRIYEEEEEANGNSLLDF
jgi:hypothetical protein